MVRSIVTPKDTGRRRDPQRKARKPLYTGKAAQHRRAVQRQRKRGPQMDQLQPHQRIARIASLLSAVALIAVIARRVMAARPRNTEVDMQKGHM
jgi:hypothetical protein